MERRRSDENKIKITFVERKRWLDNVDSLQRNPRTAPWTVYAPYKNAYGSLYRAKRFPRHPMQHRDPMGTLKRVSTISNVSCIDTNVRKITLSHLKYLLNPLNDMMPDIKGIPDVGEHRSFEEIVLSTQAIQFGNRVEQAHNNVLNTVNGAIETFQKKSKAIVQDAIDSLNTLKEEGENVVEEARSKIEEILSKLDERINEITEGIVNEVDVTECKDTAQRIKDTGSKILSNVNHCVTERIDKAEEYVKNIHTSSQDFVKFLLEINEEATECTKDFSPKAPACLALIMMRVTTVIGTKMPSVIMEIGKLAYLVNTLFPSLARCSVVSTFNVFLNEVNASLSSFEACVNERVNAY
ncbi:hypothetical protein V1478_002705 [Vespula squamosa]|uniref:Uncharacterized protein n=1 Tax=Vespula squamosa TaxID=30214 RepID=A0ABD2BTD2_VESSQ